MDNTTQLLTEAEAAELLGLAKQTLAVWRSCHRYDLPYYKIGSAVRYKRADLEAWLEENRVCTSR